MKGMVFTEFLDMVEDQHGLAFSESLLDDCALPSGGVYTAVGDYPAAELVTLVTKLSERSGTAVSELLEAFGARVFAMFVENYAAFFAEVDSVFDFLGGIENHIHVEVRKLYPSAELPSFAYPERSDDRLVMEYQSSRPLAVFALGLIRAAVAHFNEPITVSMQDTSGGAGTSARFTLTR